MKTLALTVLTFVALWFVQTPVADRIYPYWDQPTAAELSQATPSRNPLWPLYEDLERAYDVDLSHAYWAVPSRQHPSYWDLEAFGPDRFGSRPYDVMIVGDSSVTFGLDVVTASSLSGLAIGHISFEWNHMSDYTAAFYRQVLPCLLRPGGVVLVSHAVELQWNAENADAFWNRDQKIFVEQGFEDCGAMRDYIAARRTADPTASPFGFRGYRAWVTDLERQVTPFVPFRSTRIGWSDFFPLDPSQKRGEGLEKGYYMGRYEGVHWIRWDANTLTMVRAFQNTASLSALDIAGADSVPLPDDSRWEANLRAVAGLSDLYTVCMVRPIAVQEELVRYPTWRAWRPNTCLLDFPAVAEDELGLDSVTMEQGTHYGNETGQLASIALGRFLRPLAARPGSDLGNVLIGLPHVFWNGAAVATD